MKSLRITIISALIVPTILFGTVWAEKYILVPLDGSGNTIRICDLAHLPETPVYVARRCQQDD